MTEFVSSQNAKPTVVCVFCGACAGYNVVHMEAARALALEFHKNNIHLVYGGGTVGLMGELAKTLVSLSGPETVHGVIPKALVRVEEGYQGKETQTAASAPKGEKKVERIVENGSQSASFEFGMITIVPDMHTRKRLMATKVLEGGPGSGFIALPGGFGTLEEVMEMTTWNQLGIHRVGIVLLNINGYWDAITAWIQKAVKEGFLSDSNAGIMVDTSKVDEALGKLREYQVSRERLELSWNEE
ncbi:hypothetical protein G7Z17_g1308 [Cylindrodendrum hubeiense]|uniref:Cytokinin riboside 5'-monophosphate phosphoribohydrolase n=1 Tax=Cylindrodendrum hubeiense TaxID=595255 RepID=A0A9P5HF33_9HYPO|nr:hypothetical protein G7Z17_g1308 [Cylindrodendrum hubeiense]